MTGAICVINTNPRSIRFFDTPTVSLKVGKSVKNSMDLPAISRLLKSLKAECPEQSILVTIEKVAPMPSFNRDKQGEAPVQEERRTMGATSAFNFGVGFGMWQGVVAAIEFPYELVHPATWKSKLMGGSKGKDSGRIRAMQLFPETAKDLARKKDHGRADALLLALYGVKYGSTEQSAQLQAAPTLF